MTSPALTLSLIITFYLEIICRRFRRTSLSTIELSPWIVYETNVTKASRHRWVTFNLSIAICLLEFVFNLSNVSNKIGVRTPLSDFNQAALIIKLASSGLIVPTSMILILLTVLNILLSFYRSIKNRLFFMLWVFVSNEKSFSNNEISVMLVYYLS